MRLRAGDGIIFEIAEMSDHECVIVTIRTNIGCIKITEIQELLDCSFKSTGFGGDGICLFTVADKCILPLSLSL